MAAASSCSASTSYDVFINHRGPDVKNTFAGHLYRALKSRGLQVFLDRPELQAGHNISGQIKAAIELASVHIAIFSEHYAESKWCLEELVLMLNSRGTILPVFCNVKPSELRWTNKRKYAEALQKHEENQLYEWQTIQEWKKALSKVADISGLELEACNGDEVELLDQVLQRVLKMVPKPPLYVAKYKIGVQEKLEDFERAVLYQLEEEHRMEAKVVGVVGSGGIGKSTLARAFFNSKRSNYNCSSFLVDVRENAARKSLHFLQKQLIKDLTGIDIPIASWEEGIGKLNKNLTSCHALIILDDADHRNQLDAFLHIKHVLNPKSLVLVTSRDKHLLRSVRIVESSIYHHRGLDRSNSLELFCWHAFFQPHPLPEFIDLVDGFVKACDGLPLSLEVFGALLCQENDRSYWEEQLDGLQMLPHEIQVRLKISYDSLNPEEQQIFLDIACFSIGENKDKWIRIWGGSLWKGSVGLRNLENKCLVEVDSKNKIRMHDHLRDLGRNIAKEESMPRRLWSATVKDVSDLLEQSSSATKVRGIKMAPDMSDNWEEGSIPGEMLKISKLQLLEAEGFFVERILSKAPLQLRELKVDAPLMEFPNSIGQLQYLEKIEVNGYLLQQVQAEFCHLLSLKYLKLSSCSKLQVLPSCFGKLTNLQYIDLSDCSKLQTLPHSFCNLTNLREINLERCTNLEMPPNFLEKFTNLQEINLGYCEKMEVLSDAFGTLTNLQKISLQGCKRLKTLPKSIENLTNICEINLEDCESLEVLPDGFGTLTNLQEICLQGCKSLKTLPNFIENLRNLLVINLKRCEWLEVLPDAFGTSTNLKYINLEGCKSLKMLPNSIENLINLEEINLERCVSLEVLPDAFRGLTNLRKMSLIDCKSLKALPNSIENLTNLCEIDLEGCESLEVLPNAFWTLTNLQILSLCGCKSLKTLPNSIENLTNLRDIRLKGCESLEVLPNALGGLANLEYINLEGCKSLKMLPDAFGTLTNLEFLNLRGCESLEVLPNSIENLPNLLVFDL